MKTALSQKRLKCRPASILLLAFSIAACTSRETGDTTTARELEQLRAREQSLLRANDSLLTLLTRQPVENPVGSYIIDGTTLKRANIPETPDGLGAYLQEKHPELIGAEGVLGGTMRFEEALPLAGQYVFASLSDGHIMAYALLRYERKRDGTLAWQRVYTSPKEN